jgi:hypothetical protein
MENESTNQIVDNLFTKGISINHAYQATQNCFDDIKNELKLINRWISGRLSKYEDQIHVSYKEHGEFEARLNFGSDTLVFLMHTNVFTFPADHFLFKTNYIKQNPLLSNCGMIMIYNFLYESVKYNRLDDPGYLMARIFINEEKHFFIQGQRQYSFLFRDFENLILEKRIIRDFVLQSIRQAIDLDPIVPPIEAVSQITLQQIMLASDNFMLKSAKRLGFGYNINNQDKE